jgi:1,4-alpha-glucan branching enzyme
MGTLWHELTNRRQDEKTISYVECHDQAIVGGKTVLFRLLDHEIYEAMHLGSRSLKVDRGIALHKLFRLATLITAGHGYLNFMGNEFGHPEWIDFPREGNGWSYKHARRLWFLADDPKLRYRGLRDFDRQLLGFARDTDLIAGATSQAVHVSGRDRIINCERHGYWFFLNFNTTQSFADYSIEVLPGRYEWVFDSDEPRFGGHGRISPNQVHVPLPVLENGSVRYLLRLYLPSATGLVLRRVWE